MKSIFFLPALICSITVINSHKVYCQVSAGSQVLIGAIETFATKYSTALPQVKVKDYRNNINIKAVRNFVRKFRDAKNVSWCRTNDGIYIARFTTDSIQTMSTYSSGGSWIYSLKKYAENKMPDELRTMVKSTYFDYLIVEVREISLSSEWEKIIYNVLIKRADNFKILQICNKEMETISDYTKP